MGRTKADEYKGTLLWMLSDASSYLNGAIIPVDGVELLGSLFLLTTRAYKNHEKKKYCFNKT